MAGESVYLNELRQSDLPFLLDLWKQPEVMRYADELPGLRGWSKSEGTVTAWAKYLERRRAASPCYIQMVLHSKAGKRIGESFFVELPEGFTLDAWKKPENTGCPMGDLKLLPAYWNRGLGTEGMKLMVRWLFENTNSRLVVVPPHHQNPAAARMYEKAGFVHTGEGRSWEGHRIMELRRERFETMYVREGQPDPGK